MRNSLFLSILGLALFSTGCLSANHQISKGELLKLTNVAPEQRGDKVRVVQDLVTNNSPARSDRVHGNTVVYVHSPIWVGGSPHHHHHHQGGSATSSGGNGGGHVSGGKSSGKTGGGFGDVAKGKKADSKALLVLAGVVAVGLAATEGARYDGWLKLHPMHPVHLYGPYGEHTVLPLAHIDAQTAQWASYAMVRESEGSFSHLGRAPLNRQGFTYSLMLGAGQVPVKGFDADPGFTGHIQFGYFPTKKIGLQLDLGMAWTEDDAQETIYTSRTSLEVQGHLVDAGKLHAGLFGQVGVASRFDDGIGFDDNSNLLGAGALMQLELTTRLALTGRVGATHSFGEWANEIGVGVSIY